MNVGMMQPSFLPWQGFFELIARSDRFIFLDDFQFSVQSYHQRNHLFVNKGQVDWYSVPVRKSVSFKCPLNVTRINESVPWRSKTWKRIQQNYSKANFFRDVAPEIERWLFTQTESLAEQNMVFIKMVCEMIGIRTEFRMSHDLPSEQERSDRVVELLRWCEADIYYCANGSFGYMADDGVFPVESIKVLFQTFEPKPYWQVSSPNEFVPYLSVLDALMNVGPEQTRSLIQGGTSQWLAWEEMMSFSTSQREKIKDSDNEY
jgi:hypothetical protein